MGLQIVTDADFEKNVLKSNIPVLVDFWAPWCGPCRIVGPILEELAPQLGGKVNIVKLNVDENPVTSQNYGILSIPSMLLFKDGQILDKTVGALPKQKLETWLNSKL